MMKLNPWSKKEQNRRLSNLVLHLRMYKSTNRWLLKEYPIHLKKQKAMRIWTKTKFLVVEVKWHQRRWGYDREEHDQLRQTNEEKLS